MLSGFCAWAECKVKTMSEKEKKTFQKTIAIILSLLTCFLGMVFVQSSSLSFWTKVAIDCIFGVQLISVIRVCK